MSRSLHYFVGSGRCAAVALPFPLDAMVADWNGLRQAMVRQMDPSFSRDEWAYLISFLSAENLEGVFTQCFGRRTAAPDLPPRFLFHPRGLVGIWLPNNVSLLGPLTLILMSLTGNPLWLKGGTQSSDLTGAFLRYALAQLAPGVLRTRLDSSVRHDVFDREDARNVEMAGQARVRIVFGTDAAASAIHALPHPRDSVGVSFVDRRSEAWIQKEAVTDALLVDILRVFAIYGQAGCTSPRRVVVLDADGSDVLRLRDRLLALWPSVVRGAPAAFRASENIMCRQWAAAQGWNAALAERNAALLAAGTLDLEEIQGDMVLMLVPATVPEAVAHLPPNVQTVGCALTSFRLEDVLSWLHDGSVKRIVPLQRMHHFGPVWDGQEFWRQTFEAVELPGDGMQKLPPRGGSL